MMARRKRLGEILVNNGLITREQLNEAQEHSIKEKNRIGEALISLGYLTDTDVYTALGDQLGVPYVSLSYYSVDPDVISMVPEQLARQHTIIPLFRVRGSLTLGMADPLNIAVIDQVVRSTGLEIEPSICSEAEIERAIDHYYGTTSSMDEVMTELDVEEAEEEEEGTESVDAHTLTQMAGDAPIVKLVNLMFALICR